MSGGRGLRANDYRRSFPYRINGDEIIRYAQHTRDHGQPVLVRMDQNLDLDDLFPMNTRVISKVREFTIHLRKEPVIADLLELVAHLRSTTHVHGKCCTKCGLHQSPHVGCILR